MQLQSNQPFQEFLLKIGQGESENTIQSPPNIIAKGISLDGLIHDIFGEGEEFDDRVILTIKNEDVHMINSKVLNLIPGDMFHSFSSDFVNKMILEHIQ
jgi:hypothetical protein